MANAAMSAKAIRTILTQECMRRLRNTSVEMGGEIQRQHLDRFMLKLKNSVHSVQYRKQILDSAIKGFDKMLEEDKNGTKPLFRNRQWNEKERLEMKKNNKHTLNVSQSSFLNICLMVANQFPPLSFFQ